MDPSEKLLLVATAFVELFLLGGFIWIISLIHDIYGQLDRHRQIANDYREMCSKVDSTESFKPANPLTRLSERIYEVAIKVKTL